MESSHKIMTTDLRSESITTANKRLWASLETVPAKTEKPIAEKGGEI